MLNDFDLIQHSFDGDVTIYPIADVHLGACEHAEPEWQSFLKRVEHEDAYLILAGDLLNNNTRGVRFANPFDEVLRPREAKRRMVEYLEPLRDRILCVVEGNHEARTVRDSDQSLSRDICTKLDIEHLYRESIAFMALSCGVRKYNGKPLTTYTFCVTHGSFGGALTGGAVNKNERFSTGAIEGLDCFVSAHVHKGFVTKPAKICIDAHNRTVSMKHVVVVSCVSWLDYGGYAARGMMFPSKSCDPQQIRLHADTTKRNKRIITTW